MLCEPDSREPWFISSEHDDRCLSDTLKAFESAVDVTTEETKTGTQEKFWVSMQAERTDKKAEAHSAAAE